MLVHPIDLWPAGTRGFVVEDPPWSRTVIVGLPSESIPGSYQDVRVPPGSLRRVEGGGRHLRVVT